MTPQERAYLKRYRLAHAQGIATAPVPVSRVTPHVQELLAAGMTRTGIARTAGVSPQTVIRVLSGEQPTIQRATARRLLALTPAKVMARPDPDGLVPAEGMRRRIRALLALGWRHADISALMPIAYTTNQILHEPGPWTARRTHDAVRVAYDALAMKTGPSEKTRHRAAARGYLPPLAWDDDTIDDPNATPTGVIDPPDHTVDVVAIARATAGIPTDLTRLERITVVRALTQTGTPASAIAKACKAPPRTIERDRAFHGPLPITAHPIANSRRTAA